MRRCLLALALLVMSCSPLAAVKRTLSAVRAAGVATDRIIREGARAQDKTCSGLHAARTPAYATCMGRWPEAIKHWVQIAKPSVNTALRAGKAAVEIAERTKAGARAVWPHIRTAICALLRVPGDWRAVLGRRADLIQALITPIAGGLQCP